MAPLPRAAIRRRAPVPRPVANLRKRISIEYVAIDDIAPYEFNARLNEEAVPAVAESIKAFGFLVPCVVDVNNTLVAGHTRIEAARLLGIADIPCIRSRDLTPDQLNAFRLVDNKVSEIARWDFDLLGGEISKLVDTGIDWTLFGWTQEDIDCLSDVVSSDTLDAPSALDLAAGSEVSARRAPVTARCVIGEIVFFVPASDYRRFADGLRQLHDFNETAIVADIKRRLGLLG